MEERSSQPPAGQGRAVRLDSFGGPDVLAVREVPAPQAARDRSVCGSPRPA